MLQLTGMFVTRFPAHPHPHPHPSFLFFPRALERFIKSPRADNATYLFIANTCITTVLHPFTPPLPSPPPHLTPHPVCCARLPCVRLRIDRPTFQGCLTLHGPPWHTSPSNNSTLLECQARWKDPDPPQRGSLVCELRQGISLSTQRTGCANRRLQWRVCSNQYNGSSGVGLKYTVQFVFQNCFLEKRK